MSLKMTIFVVCLDAMIWKMKINIFSFFNGNIIGDSESLLTS